MNRKEKPTSRVFVLSIANAELVYAADAHEIRSLLNAPVNPAVRVEIRDPAREKGQKPER